MKQFDVITAMKVLQKINDIASLPCTISYRFYKLTSQLQHYWDWQINEEKKLYEKYGTVTEQGTYEFLKNNQSELTKALTDISQTEVEQDWNVINIPLIDDLHISANDIKALQGFVDFIE